jgi:hypothetical protein
MNIIWGYKADPHITAQQLRNTYAGIFGGDTHILDTGSKLAATVVSATEVQIADGVMIAQGCTASIEHGETESLTIANGSQGMFRKDLIVARYTKTAGTGVENMALAVITGTPASASPAVPSHNTGVIADGDSPIDFPLYVVNLDGISITSVDALVDTISINGAIEDFTERLETAEGNMPTFVVEEYTEEGITIGANSARAYTKNIAKTGYTPIAMSGVWIENGTGGRNGGWVIAQNWYIGKITVNNAQVDGGLFTLWNQNTSQSATVKLSFQVTYVSNNAVRG